MSDVIIKGTWLPIHGRRWLPGVLLALLGNVSAQAQTPPTGAFHGPRSNGQFMEPPALQQESPTPLFVLPKIRPPDKHAPLSEAPKFLLRGVQFQGNAVFNNEQLAVVTEPYIGQRVSIEELQEIRRALTLYYVESGYINSGAVIPDQNIDFGVVTMVLIEGALSEIDVDGNVDIHSDYIRDRIWLGAGPPLNVRELQERVQFLLQDPLVKRVDVRLDPGVSLGDAKLYVDVVEEKRFGARLSFTNSRPPGVASFEGRADVEARNFSGWGDAHRLTFARTKGLTELSFKTEMPITAYDTRVSFGVSNSRSEVREKPFSLIDVASKSRDLEVGLTHPIFHTISSKLTLGLEFASRKSETSLLGAPFSFSLGPINGVSRVRVFRFVQDWVNRTQDQVVAVRSSINKGVNAFGATNNSPLVPDGDFISWLGQVQWVRRISEDVQVIFRSDAQFTTDRLLPLEKYSVGGINSVRGYRENQLVKDQGYSMSLEGRIHIGRLPIPGIADAPDDGKIQLAPFVDFGRAWEKDIANTGLTKIYSVGVGLLWRITPNINATLYVAHPLRDAPNTAEKSLQDDGVHFKLVVGVL